MVMKMVMMIARMMMVTMMVIKIAMDCDDNGAQLIQALPIRMIVTKICTQPRRIDINFKDNPTKNEISMKRKILKMRLLVPKFNAVPVSLLI